MKENSKNRFFPFGFLFFLFSIAVYTQFRQIVDVPGLHFDEGWQAIHAHRIATEKGFWPMSAMNSYTAPVFHYFLGSVFKFFGSTLEVERFFLGSLNILSLLIFVFILWKANYRRAAYWFILLWALLPINVHNHRFFVEVTVFHTFCFALFSLGIVLFKKQPQLGSVLFVLAYSLGILSHVLFITVFLSAIVVFALKFPEEFYSKHGKNALMAAGTVTAFCLIRMGYGLQKALPLVLATGLILFLISQLTKFDFFWSKLSQWIYKLGFILGSCLLFLFALVFWNGFWPYAQMTSDLNVVLWLPINFIFLLYILFFPERNKNKSEKHETANWVWAFFILSLVIAQCLIFKPSSRYYTLPTILLCLWVSLKMQKVSLIRMHLVWAIPLVLWNVWAFEKKLITPFQTNGAFDQEFRFLIFHDTSRDFRPIQKAWKWIVKENCQDVFHWLENDRYMYPVNFLKISTPPAIPGKTCSWTSDALYFSHIPNYSVGLKEYGAPVENVRFLYHEKNWGDLAFFIKKEK